MKTIYVQELCDIVKRKKSMNEFYVPLDGAIRNFAKHIHANPRTILSSKFGDGKSFFLQKMKEDEELKKEYEFLTIYPVNYQVVGNKDIFDLIKRDILFQLMLHGMIGDSVVLEESEAFSWFVYMKGKSLVADLLPYVAELGLEPEETATVMAAMKGLKLFKSAKEKFEKFKKEQLETNDERIDAFIEKADSHYLYECDVITRIIQKTIKDYQEQIQKKVVLIVEDLDRIDPAHLFRILNVLSAHIDYGYKYFVKPDTSLVGNKFGFDNIVLVIDYNNLKHIYKHFYGEHTDFDGYISKFLSSVPFPYSLQKQKREYVVKRLMELTELDENSLNLVFPNSNLLSKTMRETVQSFDIGQSIVSTPMATINDNIVILSTSFIRVMAILRRLKYSDAEIIKNMLALKDVNQNVFVRYILPYVFLLNKNLGKSQTTIYISEKGRGVHQATLELDKDTGTASIQTRYIRQGNEVETNFQQVIDLMFDYIS